MEPWSPQYKGLFDKGTLFTGAELGGEVAAKLFQDPLNFSRCQTANNIEPYFQSLQYIDT